MSSVQPALHLEPCADPFTETCPTSDQPIPNEKANEIRARAAAMEKRLANAADARAADKVAIEKAKIEAAAKAKIEEAERQKNEAVT
jgi:hypothetical protein